MVFKMKKNLLSFSSACLFFSILIPTIYADWVQDGGSLNVNTGETAGDPVIAFSGTTPYVAWQEDCGSLQYQIFVKHYNGSSWIQDGISLNLNTEEAAYAPSIAIYNGTPYVAFREYNAAGKTQIFLMHYNGSAWVQDGGTLNVNTSESGRYPKIAMFNGTPYVTWYEPSSTFDQVYVKHYNGSSWVQDGGSLNLNTSQDADYPCIAVYNGTPYVGWSEYNGSDDQIYVKHYNGSAWVQDGGTLNVNTTVYASNARIAIYNGTPYVAWEEAAAASRKIYVKHYNGSTWIQDGASLNVYADKDGDKPTIDFYNSTPYVSWSEDYGTFQDRIYVKYYNGSSWLQVGGELNVNSEVPAYEPAIALLNSTPYVTWYEKDGSKAQINVKHYDRYL